MKHSFFRESLCKNKYLHRFDIVGEYDDGVMEVCQICKMKKFFKINQGKVDNQAYMDWHLRLALPPSHPFSSHEFSYEPLSETISPYF